MPSVLESGGLAWRWGDVVLNATVMNGVNSVGPERAAPKMLLRGLGVRYGFGLVHRHRQLGEFMSIRSEYIDSLRGLSILAVLFYHFFGMGPLAYGNLGVLLFFVISGYCIAISMESSLDPFHFYAKRLGRLLPGLLACGLITAAVKINFPYLLAERPVNWSDPFLTALSLPTLDLLRISYHFPDWAYWSLIVEFQFYALIALLMSVVRGVRAVRALVLITLCSLALLVMGRWNHPPLLVHFLPFFVAGMSLRLIAIDRNDRTGWIGVVVALFVEGAYLHLGISTTALPVSFGSFVTLTFAVFLLLCGLKQGGQGYGPVIRVLAAAGMISYPLYLLHQDIGNTILYILGADCGDIVCVVDTTFQRVVVVPISMIVLAWMVHRGVERPLIAPLTEMLARLPAVLSSAMHSALRHITGGRQ